MSQIDISFIIPTYNEEYNLPNTLNNIIKFTPPDLNYEIIIADNGSSDNTKDIAVNYKTKLIIDETTTVGGLRNLAVQKAEGKVLVFLDADVLLTENWMNRISDVIESIEKNPMQITGSKCGVPKNAGWLERNWFQPLVERKVNYINSGHLITSRMLFDRIKGFDERLETGEDYAFSQVAKSLNAKITNDSELQVLHTGYPKTLRQFIKREIWHGVGEGRTLRTILTSNVAMISIFFACMHGITIMGYTILENNVIGILGLGAILALCLVSAMYKHHAKTFMSLASVSTLYYIYFLSRFLACIPIVNELLTAKHHR